MKELKQIIEGKEWWENLLEKWANIEHERWAKWQKYMHSKMFDVDGIGGEPTGDMILPKEFHKRWERQIATPYSELSEKEKDSDREQVHQYLDDIRQIREQTVKEVLEAVVEMVQSVKLKKEVMHDHIYYYHKTGAEVSEEIVKKVDDMIDHLNK